MSDLGSNVVPMGHMSPELAEQFAFLGQDFSVQALRRSLEERSLFREARAVIRSFIADSPANDVLGRIYHQAYFSTGSCEPDVDPNGEVARYELVVDDIETPTNTVYASVSPNALNTLYTPLSCIVEEATVPELTNREKVIRDRAIELAYRGAYCGIVAKYVTMVRPLMDEARAHVVWPQLEGIIEEYYRAKFGNDGVTDEAVRMERIAACLSGAVMFRALTLAASESRDVRSGLTPTEIGNQLKLITAGMRPFKPGDHKAISFGLVNAFQPADAARFMKAWFAPR